MIYKGESKYKDKHITEHFKVSEIVCKDGSKYYTINSKVLEGLEILRGVIKKPIIINSAYRSPRYNKRVGGASNSQHVLGNAIDFRVSGMTTQQIFDEIKKNGMLGKTFTGVGLYNNFIHVDVRNNPNKRGYSFWDCRSK